MSSKPELYQILTTRIFVGNMLWLYLFKNRSGGMLCDDQIGRQRACRHFDGGSGGSPSGVRPGKVRRSRRPLATPESRHEGHREAAKSEGKNPPPSCPPPWRKAHHRRRQWLTWQPWMRHCLLVPRLGRPEATPQVSHCRSSTPPHARAVYKPGVFNFWF